MLVGWVLHLCKMRPKSLDWQVFMAHYCLSEAMTCPFVSQCILLLILILSASTEGHFIEWDPAWPAFRRLRKIYVWQLTLSSVASIAPGSRAGAVLHRGMEKMTYPKCEREITVFSLSFSLNVAKWRIPLRGGNGILFPRFGAYTLNEMTTPTH